MILRIVVLLAVGLQLIQTANSQPYEPGNRVQAARSGKWHKAIVLSKNDGVYEVAFDDLKDEQTNKRLQSSLPAESLRPCANCNPADGKKPVPPRPPLKLPLLQKASDNSINAAIAKNIIQATWEDPAQYVDGDIKVINADIAIMEIGKPVKQDSSFVTNESLAPEMPVYPVTVAVKVRRYKSNCIIYSDGEYIYRMAINKMGNWVAIYVATRTETPLETTYF